MLRPQDHWKQRIRQETGMPWYEAFALLAKRGHSKKGAADILGISKATFYKHCAPLQLPWVPREETIEFQECRRNRQTSKRLYSHLREIQHARTRAACHTVGELVGTIEVLANHFGKASPRTVRRRLAAGWPLEKALTTLTKPTRPDRRHRSAL